MSGNKLFRSKNSYKFKTAMYLLVFINEFYDKLDVKSVIKTLTDVENLKNLILNSN